MMKVALIICFQFFLSYLTSQESTLLRLLFDSSELVGQGAIASNNCIGYSLCVEECRYKVRVDSIYKGFPNIYPVEFVVGFDPDSGPSQNLDIIYFTRDCFINESCPNKNQNVILFLRDNPRKEGYKLVDRWLGVQTHSYSLAAEVRKMKVIISE